MEPILITGALGNVGSEIIRQSLDQGYPIRAADINLSALKSRFGDSVETIEFDFVNPETYKPALASVKKLFLMRPPHISNVKRYMFPFLDSAKLAGVDQIVFLSLIGIEQNQRAPHYKVEQYLIKIGIPYTFLRASFFMQNLSSTHQLEIRDHDEIYLPVGSGKTSFIDVRDIAAVAVKALTVSSHQNQAYELTGPEALDYYQVAEILSTVLGRKITYRNPSSLAFTWKSLRYGRPLGLTIIMSYLYAETKRGMSANFSKDVERILGRSPTSMRQFALDFQHKWKKTEQE